ncbi:hypothetical protein BH10CHL1_BH10CHL1_13960 [soil metagenome]
MTKVKISQREIEEEELERQHQMAVQEDERKTQFCPLHFS